MIERVGLVRVVAEQLRSDFKNGLVADNEAIEAAVLYGKVGSISSLGPPRQLTAEEAAEYYIVGRSRLPKPLINSEIFPARHCDIATLVLKRRLESTDVLGDNHAKIIHGGCGEDTGGHLDLSRYWHNYHTFLGIGHTSLGRDTIVDITGDQFPEVQEPVYVGQLVDPWTRDPGIEMYEV